MKKIIEVHPGNNFTVSISFSDGFTAVVDIKPFIRGGISDQLKDPDFFKQVHVDEFHGISWINGFDFCPNFLREYIEQNQGITDGH